MHHNLYQDARIFHQLRFPGRHPTFLSWAKVVTGSRGLLVLAVHRMSYYYKRQCPNGPVGWLFMLAVHFGCYLSRVLAKCHVVPSTQIEPGVFLSNRGHIILGARTVGSGTLIHERVTIGMNLMNRGIAEIGRNVCIGPYCVINGDIKIGDGATLLPGTVLTKSVPPGAVLQGNPARVVKRDFDNSDLRRTLTADVGPLLDINKSC